MVYVGPNTKKNKDIVLLIHLPTMRQWTMEISPIVIQWNNSECSCFFRKENKPTQGYLIKGGHAKYLPKYKKKKYCYC